MKHEHLEELASVDCPVTLLYDRNGQVIGNSQHLARLVLVLSKAAFEFADEMDGVCLTFSKKLDKFNEETK